MRILHAAELYHPSVGGAQEVVRQISTRLAARGHDVTVATSRIRARRESTVDGVQIAEFRISGNAVRGMRGDVDAYRRFVADGGFDVVMTYAAQQWTTDALLDIVGDLRCVRILAPCGFSGLRDPSYAGYFRALPERLAAFDALIFHSESYQDARFAAEAGLDNTRVIPNGADEREFGDASQLDRLAGAFRTHHGIAPGEPLFLTVGGHTRKKGHALAIEALARADIERATLAIIGNTPLGFGCLWDCRRRATSVRARTRNRKRTLLLAPPRHEVLGAYRAAGLFVFGSNIECSPLVLFESVAAGTPFATLAVGNAREIAGWSTLGEVLPTKQLSNGLVAGDPDDMAVAMERAASQRAISDPERARAAWRKGFTWEKIASQYEALYRELAELRPKTGSLR